ncbi:MAG: MBL fold metallo-hydrolase [Clostridiales bacterium]|nr:MBL fold metallo-hydrolase [Candidatus Cacconaster stercorequi]
MKIISMQVGPIMTNCYLLCDDQRGVCACIDPGGEAERVEKAIQATGCALAAIYLTHGHFDHCNGVRELVSMHPDVPVYIHAKDAVDEDLGEYALRFTRLDAHNQRYYQEGDVLTLGDLRITVMETPGHSRGSVCLMVENVIFSGDTLFRASCGRTDFDGGDYREILQSLARLAKLDGSYHVYPGHDRDTDLDYERRVNPYMQQGMRG